MGSTTRCRLTSKTLDTLIDDVYEFFGSEGITLDETLLDKMGEDLKDLMRYRFESERKPPHLRLSAVGKPARQLWYEVSGQEKESFPPQTYIKFLFGDLWELVLLWAAKQTGHKVEFEQAEVEIDGVLGHNDAIIDGVVVDVKSASSFAFKKFADNTLPENDAFGYMEQLAAYCTAHGGLDGAFWAVDKQTGRMTLLRFDYSELEAYNIRERVQYMKEVLASPETPERCYDPEPDGKSGNMKLGTNCSYCSFKQKCWSDANNGIGLRTFLYSNGPRHLVTVAKEPNVFEASL